MFNGVNLDGVEEQQDRVGGEGYLLDSGVYDAKVKLAYVTNSTTSKSKCIVTVLDVNGVEITERTWIFSGSGEATYERNGKKRMLPGYEAMNDLSLVATGHTLKDQEIQEKTIKVWDNESKREVDKSMPVLVNLLDKPVTIGLLRSIENKQAKSSSGKYEDTNEKKEFNEVDKYFHTETRKTVVELMKKVNLPEEDMFISLWSKKNTGEVRNRFKEVTESRPVSSGTGSPKTTKSLFDN